MGNTQVLYEGYVDQECFMDNTQVLYGGCVDQECCMGNTQVLYEGYVDQECCMDNTQVLYGPRMLYGQHPNNNSIQFIFIVLKMEITKKQLIITPNKIEIRTKSTQHSLIICFV